MNIQHSKTFGFGIATALVASYACKVASDAIGGVNANYAGPVHGLGIGSIIVAIAMYGLAGHFKRIHGIPGFLYLLAIGSLAIGVISVLTPAPSNWLTGLYAGLDAGLYLACGVTIVGLGCSRERETVPALV